MTEYITRLTCTQGTEGFARIRKTTHFTRGSLLAFSMVIYIMPLKVYFSEIKCIETKARQSSTKMGGIEEKIVDDILNLYCIKEIQLSKMCNIVKIYKLYF